MLTVTLLPGPEGVTVSGDVCIENFEICEKFASLVKLQPGMARQRS